MRQRLSRLASPIVVRGETICRVMVVQTVLMVSVVLCAGSVHTPQRGGWDADPYVPDSRYASVL